MAISCCWGEDEGGYGWIRIRVCMCGKNYCSLTHYNRIFILDYIEN